MRILVVGAWQWRWYEDAFAEALNQLGHEVAGLGWASLFKKDTGARELTYKSLYHRIEDRLVMGPITLAFNQRMMDRARAFGPDLVFAYNGTHVLPATLRTLKETLPRTFLVQYCNDNPFSSGADKLLWRHVKASIPIYDAHFVYRHSNIADVVAHGGRNVHLLRSYYLPEDDYRQEPGGASDYLRSDVLFAGHYEPDARLEALEQVAGLPLRMNLFGGGWAAARARVRPGSPLARLFPINPVFGADYRMAISGTKIALCFLSKLNGDSYTRRNFQIPAMRTFMLSEYTPDLASLFEEGRDAEFFRSQDELVDKIRYYLAHESEREEIARKGHQRLLADGHDVVSRARQVVAVVEQLRQQ
jgi:hypothetical protein